MEDDDGSMLVPLRMLMPGYYGGSSSLGHQLAVVAPTTTTTTTAITTTASRFQIPQNWAVEEVPRSDGSRIDKDLLSGRMIGNAKYYYEPRTGQKFRSVKEVERFLSGGEYTPRKALKHNHSSRPGKMVVSGGMLLRLDKEEFDQHQFALVAPTISAAASPYSLPDGWVVEEVPRRSQTHADKYYYEPGTGRKFRSLSSVERYLAEVEIDKPLSQMFQMGCRSKNSDKPKKVSGEKVKASRSESDNPPAKINWVLADSGGITWNPFMGETVVPESVKQQWVDKFMLSINDKKLDAPSFEWQSR